MIFELLWISLCTNHVVMLFTIGHRIARTWSNGKTSKPLNFFLTEREVIPKGQSQFSNGLCSSWCTLSLYITYTMTYGRVIYLIGSRVQSFGSGIPATSSPLPVILFSAVWCIGRSEGPIHPATRGRPLQWADKDTPPSSYTSRGQLPPTLTTISTCIVTLTPLMRKYWRILMEQTE